MPLTLQQAAQMALDVQDASNLSGVVNSLATEVLPALWRESDRLGQGTAFINTHPILTLFIDKLASLNGSQCLCAASSDRYSRASDAIKRIVGQPIAEQLAEIDAASAAVADGTPAAKRPVWGSTTGDKKPRAQNTPPLNLFPGGKHHDRPDQPDKPDRRPRRPAGRNQFVGQF